jgi:excisionase family DNA binding protein
VITTRELAKRAGVSQAYIRRLCAQGILKATKPGRDWLIPDEEVEGWLRERKEKSAVQQTAGTSRQDTQHRASVDIRKGRR